MLWNQKRVNLLIDRGFQVKFILKFCLVVIVSSLLISEMTLYLAKDATTVTVENNIVVVKPTSDFILPILGGTLLVVSVLAAIIVIVLTLLYSHKIAGPVYRLKKEIDSLEEGDLARDFHIRDKDQLQALASSLRTMGTTLRGKHGELKKKFCCLAGFLEKNEYKIPPGEEDVVCKMLEELYVTLDYFKV
ncbi:MAG: hypothetical protein KAJ18_03315 [Candidatus Omnitrophica bacterium]|nr:hypothetical protein [Candidatus Omnitrophota bacterium]